MQNSVLVFLECQRVIVMNEDKRLVLSLIHCIHCFQAPSFTLEQRGRAIGQGNGEYRSKKRVWVSTELRKGVAVDMESQEG